MVEEHLTLPECITAMREVMIAVSEGETTLPIRTFMPVPNVPGKMAIMPGTIENPGPCFGIKLVCKFEHPAGSHYGSHVGMVLVFDSKKGIPLAMIEGASLTAIRTSAVSALATDLLANRDAKSLAILGYGEQALRHIRSMLSVRDVDEIRVWGRDFAKAQTFCKRMSKETGQKISAFETAKACVEDADLICTTTASKTPILEGTWLKSGCHVNLVGAAIPSSSEADLKVVTKSRYFVDYQPAALAAAGELLKAIDEGVVTADHIVGEIGEVANGKVEGRMSPEDITVYKSLGVAAQDLAAGHKLYEIARSKEIGIEVNMMDYDA